MLFTILFYKLLITRPEWTTESTGFIPLYNQHYLSLHRFPWVSHFTHYLIPFCFVLIVYKKILSFIS